MTIVGQRQLYISFFNELGSVYSKKAINNYNENKAKYKQPNNLKDALWYGFHWNETPEGSDFWFKLYNSL